MRPKTEDQFRAELEAARAALAEQGRQFGPVETDQHWEGLKSDFELPYSSLPSISTDRWKY